MTTTTREYTRLRAKGWRADNALHCARAKADFDALGEDCVRVRIEPDECADFANLEGDCFDPRHNPDIRPSVLERQREEFRERVEREGVWGFVAEFRDPRTGKWEHADSCWGFVGERDAWESGYAYDGMRAAVDAYKATLAAMTTWTVESGRTLCRKGIPVATLHRVAEQPGRANSWATGGHTLPPWEADELAHRIADALNATEVVPHD